MEIGVHQKEILLQCITIGMLLSTTSLLGKVSTDIYVGTGLSLAEELFLHHSLDLKSSELPLLIELILEYDLEKDCLTIEKFIDNTTSVASAWMYNVRLRNFKIKKTPTPSQILAQTFCSLIITVGIEHTLQIKSLKDTFAYEKKDLWNNQLYLQLYSNYFSYVRTMLDLDHSSNALRNALLIFYKSLPLTKQKKVNILVNLL